MNQEKLLPYQHLSIQSDQQQKEDHKSDANSPTKSPLKRKKFIVLREDEDPYVLELEEKIEEYERELIKRNESIFSIQRNFESISQISKKLKTENEQLKFDLEIYKGKSERYDELERNFHRVVREYKDEINELKENINNLSSEDKFNKKQLQELLKVKSKCADLEKDLQHQSMKNKDLDLQINDLSALVKASEKLVLEIKSLKQTTSDLQQNLKENQGTIKKQLAQINSLQTKLQEQIEENKRQKAIIEELTDQKNYLCSLEAKNTHIQSKERKKIDDLAEQIKKLEHQLSSQATLIYMKQSQSEEKESKLRQSQAQFQAKKEEIEQLQKLKRENQELKEQCKCKKFPKLFRECQKIYEGLKEEDLEDFEFNYEDKYLVVLQQDYNKINSLFKILTKNQSNYKRVLLKLNEKPSQLEIELSTIKDQVGLLENILKDSQLEKQNLIDIVKNVSLQRNQRDLQKILRDTINNNLNGAMKAQEQEIIFLKGKVQKLTNEIRTQEINQRNYKNQIEDLEDTLQVTQAIVQNLQKNRKIDQSIISFEENCAQVEVLLENSQKLDEKINEQIYFQKNSHDLLIQKK